MKNETLQEYNERHMSVIRMCPDKYMNIHLKHALMNENYELAELIKKEIELRSHVCEFCGEKGCRDCSAMEKHWSWIIVCTFGLLLVGLVLFLIYIKK